MLKIRSYRLISASVAMALLAVATGRAQGPSILPESVVWMQISDNDPVKIVQVLYNGKPIASRATFQGSPDWLKGMSVQVENVSHKTLTYINLLIVFRAFGPFVAQGISLGQLPEHRRLARDGSGQIEPDPNPPISVAPGQTITIPFAPALPRLQTYLSKRLPQRSLGDVHYLDFTVSLAYFADGTLWESGAFFKETHEKTNTYDRSTPEEFYGEYGRPSSE